MRRADIAGMDLITTPPGTTTRLLLEQSLAETGVPLHVAVETPHRAAIIPLVLSGAGVALLPRPMAEGAAQQGAQTVAIDPPLMRRVRLLWREPLSRPAAVFLALVRERQSRLAGPATAAEL
jgi:DNA-binding transcriptional LysR family regulator